MDNLQNFEILAKSSLESKNYSQAFDYYSKSLEIDAKNSKYWIGKGISTGWLSTPDTPRFDELISCIKTADQFNSLTAEEKHKISNQITNIVEIKVKDTFNHIDKEINKEFDTKPMGTGTLYAVHQTGKLSIQLSVGNKYSPALIKAIEALQFACKIDPSEYAFKSLITEIDLIFQHSANNVNYFKTHEDAGSRFEMMQEIRTNSTTKLKEQNPNADVPIAPPENGSGCFIATVASGDVNHSSVIQLRYFRDSVLSKYSLGQKFILKYYKYSPAIADDLSKNYFLRRMIYYFFVKPVSELTRLLTRK